MTQTKNDCACGCGHKTGTSTFLPGHDSKLHAIVLKIARGEAKTSDLPKTEATRAYLGRAPWMTAALRKAVGISKALKKAA